MNGNDITRYMRCFDHVVQMRFYHD